MGADRSRVEGGVGGKKEEEGRIPAEDESNNSDMTLPKANLALLRDDVSGFLHLTVLLRMETLM